MMIRQASSEDIEGMAIVHVDSWKTTYKDIVSSNFLDKMTYDNSIRIFKNIFYEKKEDEFILVAEYNNKIVGFAYAGPERSNLTNYKSELYSIYVLKDYQNMKIGKSLLFSVIQNLLLKGVRSMLVEVLADNTSRLFYEHMGANRIGEKYTERIDGQKLKELVYGWENINNIISR